MIWGSQISWYLCITVIFVSNISSWFVEYILHCLLASNNMHVFIFRLLWSNSYNHTAEYVIIKEIMIFFKLEMWQVRQNRYFFIWTYTYKERFFSLYTYIYLIYCYSCGRWVCRPFNQKTIINIHRRPTVFLSNPISVIERIFVRRPRECAQNILSFVKMNSTSENRNENVSNCDYLTRWFND